MLYDNEAIMAAIWQDPKKATDLDFTFKGGAWVSQQDPDGSEHRKSGGRTILRRNQQNGVLYISCNGDGFTPSQGIIKYLKWKWNTNDTYDVYRRLGEIYGISPDLSGYDEEQRKRYERRVARQPIYDAMAEYLIAALKTAKGKVAADYLAARGLRVTPRLGAINESIAADLKAALCRKFTNLSATQAATYVEELLTLGANKYRLNADDYQLIGPYYNGSGHVAGFWLRLTTPNTTYTNKDGQEQKKAKYLYTDGLIKNGYTLGLKANKPAILVEGILDAERVRQAAEDRQAQYGDDYTANAVVDLYNVVAIGGSVPNDDKHDPARSQLETLQRYGVKHLVYIPDLEYYDDEDQAKGRGIAGNMKTKATEDTIKAVAPHFTAKADGEGFISLRVAQLYNHDPNDKTKQDADSFIRTFGFGAFVCCIEDAVDYYHYQLKAAAYNLKGHDLQAEAQRIYLSIGSPMDKEALKTEITQAKSGYLADLKAVGFNASAMAALDRNGKASTYWDKTQANASRLNNAIANNASAEEIGEIIKDLAKAQAQRADNISALGFEAQANATPEQIERQIATQPEYIETTWQLYKPVEDRQSKEIVDAKEVRFISFAPAAITIVAAPTNYGKTAFLMATALQLASRRDKRYIYLSTEEDQRQLYLRACAAYIGDKWPEGSHPRKDLRQAIKVKDLPEALFSTNGLPFDVEQEQRRFNSTILPYLALIYSNEDVTTFCTKIVAQVEEWRAEGVDVGGIFIDYMQMLRTTGRSYSRADEVQAICAELNGLAKATGLPLIIGSQMNRQATQSGNYGVGFDGVGLENLSDGSGVEKIAQDAYLIWNTNKEIDRGGNDDLRDSNNEAKPRHKLGHRLRRIVTADNEIKPNTLYVENLKARDYETGGYTLLDFDGASGSIAPQAYYK